MNQLETVRRLSGVLHTLMFVKMPKPTEKSGPLAGHVRKGGTYSSPMAATGLLAIGDWVRDDLPDLLWPALYLAHRDSTDAARDFVRWQTDVLDDLNTGERASNDQRFIAECLNGRLSGLDRLVDRFPEARAFIVRRADEHGLLPQPVVRALAGYQSRPATWLTSEEQVQPEPDALRLVSKAIREAVGDGHREAVLKCLQIWAAVQAGTFRTDEMTIELLKPYPSDTATRSMADTVVRASWGASRGAMLERDPNCFDASVAWARTFWDFNSLTTMCVRLRELQARKAAADATTGGESMDPADEDLILVADGESDPLDLNTFTILMN